ncbi:hypothetical protein XELAEV_18026698mg [Xenopus laevis]|uniref:Uncharacterized protein n=1 Tax=Xenopus laevis TaxID=8355 RepID=A0A974CWN0_XENLA|nr:hypothetical protein XELAEV_18026698mg [Xenopus laevis]
MWAAGRAVVGCGVMREPLVELQQARGVTAGGGAVWEGCWWSCDRLGGSPLIEMQCGEGHWWGMSVEVTAGGGSDLPLVELQGTNSKWWSCGRG